MEKRTLTIEEMIAAGASWVEISTRVRELQRERAEKERAEKMAQAEKAKKKEAAAVARERFITAFADWGIAIGLVAEEDRTEFMGSLDETMDTFLEDMRQMMVIKKLLGQR